MDSSQDILVVVCVLNDVVQNLKQEIYVANHVILSKDLEVELLQPNFAWAPDEVTKRIVGPGVSSITLSESTISPGFRRFPFIANTNLLQLTLCTQIPLESTAMPRLHIYLSERCVWWQMCRAWSRTKNLSIRWRTSSKKRSYGESHKLEHRLNSVIKYWTLSKIISLMIGRVNRTRNIRIRQNAGARPSRPITNKVLGQDWSTSLYVALATTVRVILV